MSIQNRIDDKTFLYSEVGSYFHPTGRFDEEAFRKALREKFSEFKKLHRDKPDYDRIVSESIIAYLTRVVNYLEEKGLAHAAFSLFRTAVDEIELSGISDMIISSSRLKAIIEQIAGITEKKEDSKPAPDKMKQKIFSAALQVFAGKGYHQSTIEEIASISGIGKGSVYRYFSSKKELLNELLIEKYEEMIQPLSRLLSTDEDVLSQIKKMIEIWVAFIEKNHIVYRLIQAEAINNNAGETSMFFDYIITRLPMFKERIVSLNREKKLKTTNFYTVFYGILGFIDGVVHKWFRQGMDYPLRDEIPLILEVLFNGFVGESKTRTRFYLPASE